MQWFDTENVSPSKQIVHGAANSLVNILITLSFVLLGLLVSSVYLHGFRFMAVLYAMGYFAGILVALLIIIRMMPNHLLPPAFRTYPSNYGPFPDKTVDVETMKK